MWPGLLVLVVRCGEVDRTSVRFLVDNSLHCLLDQALQRVRLYLRLIDECMMTCLIDQLMDVSCGRPLWHKGVDLAIHNWLRKWCPLDHCPEAC
jgi:hypothetical protein